jgi:4-amino-4-deoxy-L-arabinose transferase-like glycosyltransferase
LIAGVSAALTIAWIAIDRTPPAWDQARYLSDALHYVQGFHHDGFGGVINAFFSAETYYAPGYAAFLFPFMVLLGPSVQSALVANLVLWIVLLFTVAAIARQLFGEAAGLIAMGVTATIPELLSLVHQALVDVAAATWACLALLAMLRTSHFSRPVPAALAGVLVGIGLLTKATVLVFLAGPVLVIGLRAVLRLRIATTAQQLRVAGNMVLALGLALAVAAPWYVTNWDTNLAYLRYSTTGSGSIGMGPQNPLDPTALLSFGLVIVNAMSFVLAAGIATVGLVVLGHRALFATNQRTPSAAAAKRRWSWALLVSSAVVPLAVFGTSHNQDPRQAMVVFPCFAIVFAGLTAIARPRLLRLSAIALVLAPCIAQALLAQLPPLNPVRDSAQLTLSVGSAQLTVFGPAFGVANPDGDDGTPVMRELEAVAHGRQVRVLVAQEDHVFNPNTLNWLAERRQDRLTFDHPNVLTGDSSELAGYDLAIYLPANEVAQRNGELRLDILNQQAATTVYGDQLFQVFGRSRHKVVVYGGDIAWVLER